LSSSPAAASGFSLFEGLIAFLALVTVGVGATAVVRRRRGLAA
jgi:Tfp pilus assembly protein PilV